jgi:hypothetical protein
MTKKSCPARARNYSFLQKIYTGSGTNPDSYSMETWGLSPGMKQPQHKVDHSFHIVPRLRMSGVPPI